MARIAIVGGGIAGMYAAWRLDSAGHKVSLFEQSSRLGGHADTQQVNDGNNRLSIDTGFIVFTRECYPLFTAMLDKLKVASQPASMSFSVSGGGFTYAAGQRQGLFADKRNLLRPGFWRLLIDLTRFYQRGNRWLRQIESGGQPEAMTLEQLMIGKKLGNAFAEQHLFPISAALWSCSIQQARHLPAQFVLDFMRAHDMLRLFNRPQWLTVKGGAQRYIDALQAAWGVDVLLNTRITSIQRQHSPDNSVKVISNDGDKGDFDRLIVACHANHALALLEKPSAAEQKYLSAISYTSNETILHTDTSVLPEYQSAWASWNVRMQADSHKVCSASYYMNRLQHLKSDKHFIVSLNQTAAVAADKIIYQRQDQHPEFTRVSRQAVQQLQQINGQSYTWYCGAWFGWGFHEDAVRSAQHVCEKIIETLPAC